MKYSSKIAIVLVFLAASIILGNIYLREPEFSILNREAISYYTTTYKNARDGLMDCHIAFGYTGCQDRKYNALELISALNRSFNPKQNTRIHNIEDFVETFAFYYSQGAANEMFMESKEGFKELLSTAKSANIPQKTTFGGHAPHMALRASREKCRATLIAGIGEQEENTIKGLDQNSMINFVSSDDGIGESDVHLILEYNAGTYSDVISPRANRFYLNHDVRSASLSTLEHYHKTTSELKLRKHAVAGFQIAQLLGADVGLVRFKEVRSQWEKMRTEAKQNVHVELAAFSNQNLYEGFVNDIILQADSLGANEQELETLHNYLKHNKFSVIANPYPSIKEVVSTLFEVIEEIELRKGLVSRVHAHGVSEHYLCYKDSVWNDGENSIVSGVMTAYTVCCNSTTVNPADVKIQAEDFEDITQKIKDPSIKIIKDSIPVVKLQKQGWSCLVALNLMCQTGAKMLTGLGDNISAAGFIYHFMKGVDDTKQRNQESTYL